MGLSSDNQPEVICMLTIQPILRIYLILVCTITPLHAQAFFDEESYEFRDEITEVILHANRKAENTIVLRLRTFVINDDKGFRDKIVIRFINDSVFEKISGGKKSKYVIRKDYFLDYNSESGKGEEFETLETSDSAGYRIIAHKAHPEDTFYASYCRMKYDSLDRISDYYYSVDGNKPVIETWRFEGDTLTIHSRYEHENDTLRLRYQDYVVHYTKSDSALLIRTTQRITYNADSTATRSFRRVHSRQITRDNQQRIVKVLTSDREHYPEDSNCVISNTMEAEYKQK